jgi:hypothetical protein
MIGARKPRVWHASSPVEHLPGIGKSLGQDLRSMGYATVGSLKSVDPEKMFQRFERQAGRQDPCVLYTFRCAAYAARTAKPDREKLKWWFWKGRTL